MIEAIAQEQMLAQKLLQENSHNPAQGHVHKKSRPLSGLTTPVYYDWPTELDDKVQSEIFLLMNLVLENEDTIGFPGPLTEEEGKSVIGNLARSVLSGDKHLLLMRELETHRIVGHLILSPSSLPNCRHVAEISRVFVHPEYRGVASIRFGMREVLACCERIGIESITLDVRANTRIHKLWQVLGFDTIGIMQDYARVNGKSHAGCYMYQSTEVLKDRMSILAS